jgi:hypothetical protein
MSLLRLPPETLVQIFDQVGSSFFREDLGRLTICKQWFEFALPACFKCVTLSQETLRRLITSGVTKRPSPLNYSLETLDLELRGYQADISTSQFQENTHESNALTTTVSSEALGENPVRSWRQVLDSDLAQLATIARQSRMLRTLRIRAWSSPPANTLGYLMNYLPLPTIQGFLSLENLSVLVLDLSVGFLSSPGEQENGHHICPSIAALLPTLRILHLRMHSICPDVLKPQGPENNLRLSELVINLSLTTNQPGITSAAHSKRCGGVGGLLHLISDIREQTAALAARMGSPRIVRILTHSLPLFEIQSFDVLTGKMMVLDDDMAWDEDGKIVMEDSEPESELLDDDLSSFSDD